MQHKSQMCNSACILFKLLVIYFCVNIINNKNLSSGDLNDWCLVKFRIGVVMDGFSQWSCWPPPLGERRIER